MTQLASPFSRRVLLPLGLIVLLAWIYGPWVASGKLTNFDDPVLIGALKDVHSLKDYLDLRSSGKILDVQPLRDFFWVIQHALSRGLGHPLFSFFNVALFFSWLFVSRSIWLACGIGESLANALTLFLCVNPIFTSTVAWPSAQKHLLGALWIALATRTWVRSILKTHTVGIQTAFATLGFYLLSLVSQPIGIAWPLFAAAFFLIHGDRKKFRIPAVTLTVLFLALLAAYWVNQNYYQTIYPTQGIRLDKYVSTEEPGLTWQILILGRMAFQTFLPLFPNFWDHNPGHFSGVVGIAFLPLLPYLAWKKRKTAPDSLLWLSAGFLAVAPVVVRITNVFAADTYLLHAWVCLWTAAAFWLSPAWNHAWQNRRGWVFTISAGMLITCLSQAIPIARAFDTPVSLWRMAYEKEATPQNTGNLAHAYLQAGMPEPSIPYFVRLANWKPETEHLAQNFCLALNRAQRISYKEKIRLLSENWVESPYTRYYRALWFSADQQKENARREAKAYLERYSQPGAAIKEATFEADRAEMERQMKTTATN